MKYLAGRPKVQRVKDETAIYLYHGTNCWRRWEINRSGSISPGRNGYSFFCNSAAEAMAYARSATLRDGGSSANSLISEPVVLKVKFTDRTWLQVDFIQDSPTSTRATQQLTIAVVGPINSSAITSVENCSHAGAQPATIRSFADGTLRLGIQRLRRKSSARRLDAWVLKHLCHYWREFTAWAGGKQVQVTEADQIRRLVLASR